MNKNEIAEKTRELIAANSCQPLKEISQNWLDCMDTEKEAEATAQYIEELKADIIPIDNTIAFFSSERAIERMGAERAAERLAGAKAAKAAGAKYCNCAACTIAGQILDLFGA